MMKRILVRLIFTCIIMGLLTSGTTYREPASAPNRNSLSAIRPDTTDFLNLIEADTFKLTILKPSSGVQFYKDGIVFLSLAKNEEKITAIHISFGTVEAYYAKPLDSVLGKHMVFSPLSSFSYPCDGISFSPDFNTMYFTKIPKKEKKEKIFKAKFTSAGKAQAGWVPEIIPMDFCKDNFTYSHPAITADESVIIFASNKEGSLGGMDLFITRKEGDTWSDPQNLGKSINTPGNEFFPFLDSDNNLFFSSDGLSGLGGYDIFTCKFNGKDWDKPINLSGRINSENDDIAFTISKMDGKTAFYTRRHQSGKGEMQLFRVTLNREFEGDSLLTISNIFHGKSLFQNSLIASNTVPEVKPVIEKPVAKKSIPEKTVAEKPVIENPVIEKPAIADQKIMVVEKKPVDVPVKNKRVPRKKKRESIVITPVSIQTTPDKIISKVSDIPLKLIPPVIHKNEDQVVYRVQFLSSKVSKGNFQITVNNKSFDTYEYLYLKEYRYTVGEFSTLASAIELQNACKRDGRTMVFIVAFKNNVRSLDPSLFK